MFDPNAHLCHYTRADTAFAHIIPKAQLLLNPYSKMRDPFENKTLQPPLAMGQSEKDHEYMERVRDRIGRCRDDKMLLSLTQGRDGSGDTIFRCAWARPRMWEQYADNHAGVCLVFDRPELLDALRRSFEPLGPYWHDNVSYTVAGFSGSEAAHFDASDFPADSLDAAVDRHVQTLREPFFFLKNQDWSAEFEYRFVLTNPARAHSDTPRPATLVSVGHSLRYVIVGERFPDWQLRSACHVAATNKVELRGMTWVNGSPWPHDPDTWSRRPRAFAVHCPPG
jgi:hypothetical protein